MEHEEDFGGSVAWDNVPTDDASAQPALDKGVEDRADHASSSSTARQLHTDAGAQSRQTKYKKVTVTRPKVELEGTKDTFVSYLVGYEGSEVDRTDSRRRFQDFRFLKSQLVRDFPGAIVPPLPEKHRMEYITGDRFSSDFIERRRLELARFMKRLARHPKLSKSELFHQFVESTEWNVFKHKQSARNEAEGANGLLDNISDTLLNAFAKLRKPDDRFTDMRAQLDVLDEGLQSIERLGTRNQARLSDLSNDYEDFALSFQGLGYLESGITEPLSRFERSLVDFGAALRDNTGPALEAFLEHVHSLLAYSNAFRNVLKTRDQKQLDFEELSSYLSNVTGERDRLAGGYNYGMGIGSYLKEKVDTLRGSDADGGREVRLHKLDARIKELQEAVIAAQDTLQAFNEELLNEETIFRETKQVEMKELLRSYAQSQVALADAADAGWRSCMPALLSIRSD